MLSHAVCGQFINSIYQEVGPDTSLMSVCLSFGKHCCSSEAVIVSSYLCVVGGSGSCDETVLFNFLS